MARRAGTRGRYQTRVLATGAWPGVSSLIGKSLAALSVNCSRNEGPGGREGGAGGEAMRRDKHLAPLVWGLGKHIQPSARS